MWTSNWDRVFTEAEKKNFKHFVQGYYFITINKAALAEAV